LRTIVILSNLGIWRKNEFNLISVKGHDMFANNISYLDLLSGTVTE